MRHLRNRVSGHTHFDKAYGADSHVWCSVRRTLRRSWCGARMRHCFTTSLPCVSYSLLAFVRSFLFLSTRWTHTDLQRHLPHMLIPSDTKKLPLHRPELSVLKSKSVGNIDRFDRPLGAKCICTPPLIGGDLEQTAQSVSWLPDVEDEPTKLAVGLRQKGCQRSILASPCISRSFCLFVAGTLVGVGFENNLAR